jgi:YVTN family beta-propeller protein
MSTTTSVALAAMALLSANSVSDTPSREDRSPTGARAADRSRSGEAVHQQLCQQVFCDPEPFGSPWLLRQMLNAGDGGIAGAPSATFLPMDSAPEGDMPRSVAITPNGQYAVVVNRDTDLMVFIDLAAVTIAASVAVGDYPIDVAISGDGKYALSTNVFSNTVSVVDIATKTLVSDIPVSGEQPFRVLATADGSRAVVGVINDGVASSFSVIDLDTLTESLTFPSTPQGVFGFFFTPAFGIGGELTTMFDLTPDGTRVVLPWRGGSAVTVYDLSDGSVSASLSVDASPSAIDISNDGSLAAIVHDGTASHVSVIDLATESVIASHTVGSFFDATVARLTPDNQHVMTGPLNSVAFVNLATGAIDATVNTGTVGDIEVSADGQWAFVSNFNAAVINLATKTLAKTITFGACVDAAASPSTNVAVALNNRFREEVYAYNLNGASSNLRGWTRSGPAPEIDAPKEIALSADGHTALVANSVSRNVSLVDLASRTVTATIDTGDVPRESAFTPNGQYAVVCNGDANTVSIIDVAAKSVVKTLNTGQRPSRVRVNAAGTEAYVASIAGTDALFFITLAGANSSIATSFPIGQLGAANGYPYSEVSGMELSPDGKYLAFAISFENTLKIVDTASRTVVANVAVGNFPIRALWTADSSRIFVANAFSDDIAIVERDGSDFALGNIIGGIDFPLDMALDADGDHLYVGRCSFQTPAIDVISVVSGSIVGSVALPGLPREGEYLADRDEYIVTTDDGGLARIDAAGESASLIEVIPISGSAPDMRFSPSLNLAVASWPGVPDGLDLIDFDGGGIFGDLNGDGLVGAPDLAILLGAWGSSGPADLDGSGDVGAPDIALLLGAWSQP